MRHAPEHTVVVALRVSYLSRMYYYICQGGASTQRVHATPVTPRGWSHHVSRACTMRTHKHTLLAAHADAALYEGEGGDQNIKQQLTSGERQHRSTWRKPAMLLTRHRVAEGHTCTDSRSGIHRLASKLCDMLQCHESIYILSGSIFRPS